jgi:hypothetical protein
MAEGVDARNGSDPEDHARVAALVARAGLRLSIDQIIGLVSAYRTDRTGFERLRATIAADDETVRTFCAARSTGARTLTL